MYLMVMTRPDLGAAVQLLSRFMSKPAKSHWEGVKRVFRYLMNTKDLGLKYNRSGGFHLEDYSDSDWGGCLDTRRSTSGYVFLLGGAAISWSCKRQDTVAMSTCEAEYMAASHAANECVWAASFIQEVKIDKFPRIVKIYIDNISAINLSKNSISHARTKHIDIRAHFLRELVEDRKIEFTYISTEKQVADSLTKGVPAAKTIFCRESMGVTTYP